MVFSKLKVEPIKVNNKTLIEDGYKQYVLKKPLVLTLNDKSTITIPAGFKTDLASIPYPLSNWIKRDNKRYIRSVIVHDYLYGEKRAYSRKYADDMLFECMKAEKVPFRYLYPMYWAVRLFGWVRH